jgi:hypothetical protein
LTKPKANPVIALKAIHLLQNHLSMALKENRIKGRTTTNKMEIHPVLELKIKKRVDKGRIYQIFNRLIFHHKVSLGI